MQQTSLGHKVVYGLHLPHGLDMARLLKPLLTTERERLKCSEGDFHLKDVTPHNVRHGEIRPPPMDSKQRYDKFLSMFNWPICINGSDGARKIMLTLGSAHLRCESICEGQSAAHPKLKLYMSQISKPTDPSKQRLSTFEWTVKLLERDRTPTTTASNYFATEGTQNILLAGEDTDTLRRIPLTCFIIWMEFKEDTDVQENFVTLASEIGIQHEDAESLENLVSRIHHLLPIYLHDRTPFSLSMTVRYYSFLIVPSYKERNRN